MRAHLRAATIVCISVLLPMFGWSAPPKDTCTPCIDRLFSQGDLRLMDAVRHQHTLVDAHDPIVAVMRQGELTLAHPRGGYCDPFQH
jgi:hypothetical protein